MNSENYLLLCHLQQYYVKFFPLTDKAWCDVISIQRLWVISLHIILGVLLFLLCWCTAVLGEVGKFVYNCSQHCTECCNHVV
jgi:hypothetical protein